MLHVRHGHDHRDEVGFNLDHDTEVVTDAKAARQELVGRGVNRH
jgi:hypothetical protein